MSRTAKPKDHRVFQLKVTLKGTKPPIWRRLLVRADSNLTELHNILQCAMGWTDTHLHQFIANGRYYRIPFDYDDEVHNETKFRLTDLVRSAKSKLTYEYDFGDGWEHQILVEKAFPSHDGDIPQCIAGKGACPPEDCGGVWGYYNMLEALGDSKHPDHDHFSEWIGEGVDPNAFDAAEVNELLAQMRKQPRQWRLLG